jgi:hypothetical protein
MQAPAGCLIAVYCHRPPWSHLHVAQLVLWILGGRRSTKRATGRTSWLPDFDDHLVEESYLERE